MHRLGAFVLMLCAITGCQSNTFRLGACPRVIVMKNLEFDRFLGEWYVIQRFNPMATCTKLVVKKGSDGTYSVNETSRPLGLNLNFQYQILKPRKLHFLRNDTQSIFRMDRDLAHFTLSTFGIVDTDYENYALVWGCDPVLFGSIQNVDILSRTPNPDPAVVKAAKDVLKDMTIDYQPMDNVDQTRCIDTDSNTEGSTGNEDKNTNNIVVGQ